MEAISKEAEINFEDYHNCHCIDGNATEVSIKTISVDKHLIFVVGNEHTGFDHLNDRHSYFSNENYWTLSEYGNYKLDNPSKFNPEMIPIVDYLKIAEAIFYEQNKNITKNNRPDLFDKYTGYYTFTDGISEKYHMLTYKDTKIVHTFFPDKKRHNRKIKCKYGKGIVTTKMIVHEAINELLVPYENKDGMMAYSILLKKDYATMTEKLLIQKHNTSDNILEQYHIASRVFNQFEMFDREQMYFFQNGDLSELEVIINEIDTAKFFEGKTSNTE